MVEVSKYMYRLLMYDFDSIFMNANPKNASLFILMNLFYFCSSILLTLVMIELLVSFMCDTFDRVLGEEKAAKNYERAQLIYQYEKDLEKDMIPKEHFLVVVSCISDQQRLDHNTMRHKL